MVSVVFCGFEGVIVLRLSEPFPAFVCKVFGELLLVHPAMKTATTMINRLPPVRIIYPLNAPSLSFIWSKSSFTKNRGSQPV